MSTSAYERLKLGSLELNDGANMTVESLTFNPAQKRPMFVTNSDADGENLVRESHFTNASFELKVRIEKQASIHAALVKLGELTDAVQACEKVEGGQALEWTPATTEDTYTIYALSGDITGVPIEVEGDGAGWLLGAPVVTVKLTCRPFLHSAERTVLTTTESAAEPLQVRYLKGIGGDVPAEARLIVKDTATQDRRFAMWGRDVVTSEALPTLLLTAKSGLTGSGFSGESKTRAGAYLEEKVLRGTAVSQATTLCGTGRIENVGSYAVYLRVYGTSEASRFRLSYRSGDGPLIPLEWKQPTVINGWSEIYMGSISLDAVTQGTQTGEIRVEQKATSGNPANDVNYLMLWPTKVSGKARGIAVNTATNLIAYDNFAQTAGNLEGKELGYPSGMLWGETNKTGASGFKVATGALELKPVQRTSVSDSSVNAGCFAQAGSSNYATFSAAMAVKGATVMHAGESRIGLLGRYVSTEKWVTACLVTNSLGGVSLAVIKNVSGVVATLDTVSIAMTCLPNGLQTTVPLTLFCAANGSWVATANGRQISGRDADLAAGGILATGKVGMYDAYTSSSAGTRAVEGFQLLGAEEPGRVCYSGKQVEFNSQGCLRQDSTGTYDGAPPYRGAGFYLEPEGKLGLINRVAIRMRRNDVEVEEDPVVTDKMSVEVKVRERFLLPR